MPVLTLAAISCRQVAKEATVHCTLVRFQDMKWSSIASMCSCVPPIFTLTLLNR